MNSKQLTGTEAIRATLEAKIAVAKLRSQHAETKAQRDEEAQNLSRFQKRLAELA